MLQGTTNISQDVNPSSMGGKQTAAVAIERVAQAFSDIGNALRNMLAGFTKALRDMSALTARLLTVSMQYLVNMDRRLMGLPVANPGIRSTQRTDSISVCFKWGHPNVPSTDMPSMRMCNQVQLTDTSRRLEEIGVPGNVSRERMVVAQYTVMSFEEWVRLR